MSNRKSYLRELLKRAISQPKADVVDFQALRELLDASIDLKYEKKHSRISVIPSHIDRTDSQPNVSQAQASTSLQPVLSDEDPSTCRTDCSDFSDAPIEDGSVTKTVIIQKLDLATNTLTSSISTGKEQLEQIEKRQQIRGDGIVHVSSMKEETVEPSGVAPIIPSESVVEIEQPTVIEKSVSKLPEIGGKSPKPSKIGSVSQKPDKKVSKKEKVPCHEKEKKVEPSKTELKGDKKKRKSVSDVGFGYKAVASSAKFMEKDKSSTKIVKETRDLEIKTGKSNETRKESTSQALEGVKIGEEQSKVDISSVISPEKEPSTAVEKESGTSPEKTVEPPKISPEMGVVTELQKQTDSKPGMITPLEFPSDKSILTTTEKESGQLSEKTGAKTKTSREKSATATGEQISSTPEKEAAPSATLTVILPSIISVKSSNVESVKETLKEVIHTNSMEQISPTDKEIETPIDGEKDGAKIEAPDSASAKKASKEKTTEPCVEPQKVVVALESVDEKVKKKMDLGISKAEKPKSPDSVISKKVKEEKKLAPSAKLLKSDAILKSVSGTAKKDKGLSRDSSSTSITKSSSGIKSPKTKLKSKVSDGGKAEKISPKEAKPKSDGERKGAQSPVLKQSKIEKDVKTTSSAIGLAETQPTESAPEKTTSVTEEEKFKDKEKELIEQQKPAEEQKDEKLKSESKDEIQPKTSKSSEKLLQQPEIGKELDEKKLVISVAEPSVNICGSTDPVALKITKTMETINLPVEGTKVDDVVETKAEKVEIGEDKTDEMKDKPSVAEKIEPKATPTLEPKDEQKIGIAKSTSDARKKPEMETKSTTKVGEPISPKKSDVGKTMAGEKPSDSKTPKTISSASGEKKTPRAKQKSPISAREAPGKRKSSTDVVKNITSQPKVSAQIFVNQPKESQQPVEGNEKIPSAIDEKEREKQKQEIESPISMDQTITEQGAVGEKPFQGDEKSALSAGDSTTDQSGKGESHAKIEAALKDGVEEALKQQEVCKGEEKFESPIIEEKTSETGVETAIDAIKMDEKSIQEPQKPSSKEEETKSSAKDSKIDFSAEDTQIGTDVDDTKTGTDAGILKDEDSASLGICICVLFIGKCIKIRP